MAFSTPKADAILTADLLTANRWISLWRTDPTDAETGTEESGTGYARFQMTAADWSAIYALNGGRAVNNVINIDFGTVGAGGWGAAVGWAAVHTAATAAGNMIYHYPFEGDRTVDLSVVGTPFYIPAAAFVVQVGT